MGTEPAPAPPVEDEVERSILGLPQEAAGALCYALMWASGFAFFALERRNAIVRYHAAMAVLVFVPVHLFLLVLAAVIVMAAPGVIWVKFAVWAFYAIVSLAVLALWIWMIVAAWRGRKTEVPIVSQFANRLVEWTTPEEEFE